MIAMAATVQLPSVFRVTSANAPRAGSASARFDTPCAARVESTEGAAELSERASGTFIGLIDGTFGLLRQTWSTTLLCGGIAFLPAAALYGWAYGRLFTAITAMGAEAGGAASSLPALAGAFLPVLLAALVQGLAALFVRSCVTAQAAAALRGRSARVAAIAGRVVHRAGGRILGQRALQGLLYAGVALAVVVAAGIAAFAVTSAGGRFGGRFGSGAAGATGNALFAIVLGYLAFLVIWLWLWVRFSLTLESVVIDGARALQSFGLSTSLVRGSWWRVFGWRFLFVLMLGFAASLFATPIVFFTTIRAYARYLSEMVQGTADAGSLADMVRAMGTGLPVRLAVYLYLQSLLNAFFVPVFMALLYVAMKQRASEGT
jgi:hypothetical protein